MLTVLPEPLHPTIRVRGVLNVIDCACVLSNERTLVKPVSSISYSQT